MPLILDSSGVIALLNAGDDAHHACVAAATGHDQLIIPPLTLVEVDYSCRKNGAALAFAQFVSDVLRGTYELASLTFGDLQRALDLADIYRDLDLGIVDASVVALAERLQVTTVLTLDRRDFSVIKPRHCAALTLLPE